MSTKQLLPFKLYYFAHIIITAAAAADGGDVDDADNDLNDVGHPVDEPSV